jgi:hypothetical protein
VPPLFVIFIGSFVIALRTTEELNQELETKVEHSRQIIGKSFVKRRTLEISHAAK